jgi:hypothetical protein
MLEAGHGLHACRGRITLAPPKSLSVGPRWLLILIIRSPNVPTVWARKRGNYRLNDFLGGYVLTSMVTVDMIWSTRPADSGIAFA